MPKAQDTLAAETDIAVGEELDEATAARAPPSIYQQAADYESVDASGVDLLTASPELEPTIDSPIADASDEVMPRAPPADDSMPRAPPASTSQNLVVESEILDGTDAATLTEADANLALQQALALWNEYAIANNLGDLLSNFPLSIADLDGNIIGSADGTHISLDLNAAGRGWFVDLTPEDDSEFTLFLGEGRLGAATGSDADGLVDLRTVLVHELGHIFGFDHDSSLAVMDETILSGQRIALNTPAVESGSSVTAAATLGVL